MKIDKEETVKKIIEDVRKNGDKALLKYCAKFDKAFFKKPSDLKVTKEELKKALEKTDREYLFSLRKAIKNIRFYHDKQRPDQWFETIEDDSVLGLRSIPIETVGIYVPGGRAAYPSTVLMNAIPAQIAGVKNIVMVTPAGKDKAINPYVLSAAQELGITQIYKIGGAQAIAALAYGTKTVPRVDKIVGPGNIFVTLAKKQLYGQVGIDKLAGPSDVVIIADETADVRFVALDMVSQAEHDPDSKAVLITTSEEIERDVKNQLKRTGHLKQCTIRVVKTVEDAVKISNKIAPEHLELMVAVPQKLLEKITNAGAVFMGPFSPVAAGDYIAGPNHVLPTGGTARFSSPLGVYDFVKKQSVVGYTKASLQKFGKDIVRLARSEGFEFHARAVEERFR
ncbi:MAG: histidinol dehydrogenase [Candidatus Margulisiibacteriota bacterium]